MIDREKVIRDLTWLADLDNYPALIANDAIELLKEQERLLRKKQKDIDKLCAKYSNLKHCFHEKTEIIRCKDCGYSLFKEGMVQPGYIVCTKPFTERWQAVKPNDWFCADGERR